MPFFQNSREVTINGGGFYDINGDWNYYNNSHHVRAENSHNSTSTTTTDSNNNSSRQKYFGMNVRNKQYQPDADPRHMEGRNRASELEALAQATAQKLGRALERLPMLDYQPPSSRGFVAPGKEREAEFLYHADDPSAHLPRQLLARQHTDPIPPSSNANVSRYKSKNPFRSLLKTDPELPSCSAFPHSQNKDDMDVDSEDETLP